LEYDIFPAIQNETSAIIEYREWGQVKLSACLKNSSSIKISSLLAAILRHSSITNYTDEK